MTEERGALIEAMALAIADGMRSNYVFVSDDLNNCLVDGGLFDLHDVAQAAITAISNAGYAVVPMEPSEAMEEAARDVPFIAMGNGEYAEPDRIDIYRAMLSASPITLKGSYE